MSRFVPNAHEYWLHCNHPVMTPDLILRLDPEGRLLFSGSTASAGKSPVLPPLGESIAAWAQTPDDAAQWRETIRKVIETGDPADLLVPAMVEEQERFYQAYLSPERQGNTIISLFAVLRDVTSVLSREQEMSRQNAALVQALDVRAAKAHPANRWFGSRLEPRTACAPDQYHQSARSAS